VIPRVGAASPPAQRTTPESLPEWAPLPARPDTVLDRIAEVVRTVIDVPIALVSLVDRDRQVFPGAAGLSGKWERDRATPLSHSFCQHVVRAREPLVVTDAREDPALRDNLAIADLHVVAYAGYPLWDLDGEAIGSLCAIDTEPRHWTMTELTLLDDLATACSTDLQLRAAVQRASASYQRTQALLDLSEALSVTRTVGDVAVTVAAVAHEVMGAAFGGITEVVGSGDTLRYVDEGQLSPDHTVVGDLSMASDTPSSVVIRTGKPLVITSVEALRRISPAAAALGEGAGGHTFTYWPLISRGRTLGTLTLMWTESRTLSTDERDLLAGLARYAAQAVDRAQLLAEQYDVARTLQAALLPELPTIDWLQLAGRYVPAYRGNEVGGDWYDVYPCAEDQVFVTVGDVSGHDTEAAAAMGQLRAAARAIMVDSPDDAAALLTRLERVMGSLGFERIATAVAARISREPSGATMRWSNAGHPPILVLAPGEPARLVDNGDADPLLGVGGAPASRSEHLWWLPPGATVVLFTDGLVERRGEDMSTGLDWLVGFAEEHRNDPIDELVQALVGAAPHADRFDDTVVLGMRVVG
jgi:GAF domain-containing protein